ncbi:MAG: 4Fe-4S cluster-binding domain-containing protein, partial [Candidatus Gracilibacteria bacterium]|nr:4Fe-4S cluster-binding domain-containing protein [Candidatus Gracilibacteria bacterium]
CKFRCKGCQNPELQNENGGYWVETSEIVKELDKFGDFYKSVTFSGGDPTFQEMGLIELAKQIILPKILYTGMLYEDLSEEVKDVVDIVVDGQYRENLKTGGFPASANQRVIRRKDIIGGYQKNFEWITWRYFCEVRDYIFEGFGGLV